MAVDLQSTVQDVRLYRATGYGQDGRVIAKVQVVAPARTTAKELLLHWTRGYPHLQGLRWEVAATKSIIWTQPLIGAWPHYADEEVES